jgi:putative endonuclease
MNSKQKGYKGEDIAVEHLIKHGYRIIKKNFTFGKFGEIDVIAEHNNVLLFIEVKARFNDKFGDPLFSINQKKQQHIRRAAEGYLYINKITNKVCRFDVIIVDLFNKKVIQHLENAF